MKRDFPDKVIIASIMASYDKDDWQASISASASHSGKFDKTCLQKLKIKTSFKN